MQIETSPDGPKPRIVALPAVPPGAPPAAGGSPEVIVFIHGLGSSREPFESLHEKLRKFPSLSGWQYYAFEYHSTQEIQESGKEFSRALEWVQSQHKGSRITIIGHSMGGLASRVALLRSGSVLKQVKRLIMLGTPNHGSVHTGRLGWMANSFMTATGRISAFFNRCEGVVDLTRVDEWIQSYLHHINIEAVSHVEYITIPGTFFNKDRRISVPKSLDQAAWLLVHFGLPVAQSSLGYSWVKKLSALGQGVASLAGGALGVGTQMLSLQLPHDGIVEESSVFMGAEGTNRTSRSERVSHSTGTWRKGLKYTHIHHTELNDVLHTNLHSHPGVVVILADLLGSLDLDDWRSKIPADQLWLLRPTQPPREAGLYQISPAVPVSPQA